MPAQLFGLLGVYLLLLLSVLSVVTLFTMAVGYVILRLRDSQQDMKDPQLGIKVALHYFLNESLIWMLAGVSFTLFSYMGREQQRAGLTEPERTGLAIALATMLFALLYWLILKLGTNDQRWPMVRRLFTGYRFAIHALVLLVTTTILFVMMIAPERVQWRNVKQISMILLVWGPSWLIHLILVVWYSTLSVTPPIAEARPTWDVD